MVLAACGCGAPVLTETDKALTVCFYLPLEAALSVYWELVEADLEFEAESRHEWTRLCTVQCYAAEGLVLDRPRTVQLEVRIQGERPRKPAPFAAARA